MSALIGLGSVFGFIAVQYLALEILVRRDRKRKATRHPDLVVIATAGTYGRGEKLSHP